MNKISRAINDIEIVRDDCKIQADYLRARQDVNWDCYNPESWDNMVDLLETAIALLSEKGNKNEKKI